MSPTHKNPLEKHKFKIYFTIATLLTVIITSGLYIGYESMAANVRERGYERHLPLRECAPLSESWHSSRLTEGKVIRRGDASGFIMPSRIHDEPDYEVVFLGGSTTECLSVPEKQRFPYLTGRMLEKQCGVKVNAYNGGKSGSSSNHSVLSLYGKVIPMKPDAVVLMHAINDLMFLMTAESYWAKHYRRGMIQEKHYDPIREWVTQKELGHTFLPSPKTDYDQYRGKPANLDIHSITQSFKKSLELFIFICRQHNIRPVLMTQASRITATPDSYMQTKAKQLKNDFSVDYENFHKAYSAMNQTIRDVARQQNVLLIDLAKQIAPDETMMYDSVHFTVKGSQTVARIIAETLGKTFMPG